MFLSSLIALSVSLSAAPAPDGDELAFVDMGGPPGAEIVDALQAAGLDPQAAHSLADLMTFGEGSMDSADCQYYQVETTWCDATTRRTARTYVGTTCIENLGLHACPTVNCPNGEEGFFKLTTAGTGCPSGIPGGTCVFVRITGPFVSSSDGICNNLSGCTCWASATCASRECVPTTGSPNHYPTRCPDCN